MFFFLLLGSVFIFADYKLHATEKIRLVGNNLLFPIQQLLSQPGKLSDISLDYFQTRASLKHQLEEQSSQLDNLRLMANQAEALESENSHMRKLLSLQQKSKVKSLAAEVIFSPLSPSSQRIIINRGSADGVISGMPIASEAGIMGQIVRVFENSSEAALLEDRDFAIPVLVERNGLRTVLFGVGRGEPLELRYVNNLADLDVGDHLITSGIDGTYPAGMPVAMISKIDRSSDNSGAIIACKPLAKLHHHRHLSILLYQPTTIAPSPTESEVVKNRLRQKKGN
ncbi:rod shape-determining protein MreC [Polynucleobacter sp. SHI2]|uniref:rod shape-determining protein MreC n=1 Tax=Polynucleobacter sp. SHI2 TaxID=926417 RepID=UPI00248FAACE|nr:rod shape-determining protein MreC [Polynucleobacter sp. SHI2]